MDTEIIKVKANNGTSFRRSIIPRAKKLLHKRLKERNESYMYLEIYKEEVVLNSFKKIKNEKYGNSDAYWVDVIIDYNKRDFFH